MKQLLLTVFVASYFIVAAQDRETRSLGAFTSVSSSSVIDVVLKKGDKEQVTIEASGIELNKISTEVVGSTLKIYIDNKNKPWGGYNNLNVKVYVTFRDLSSLSNSGTGNMTCSDAIETTSFQIRNSGTGDLSLDNMKVQKLDITVSGTADVEVSGSTQYLEAVVSGTADLKAGSLNAEKVNLRVSGTGNAYVLASKELTASASGTGNIYYEGSPEITDLKSNGIGKIKKGI